MVCDVEYSNQLTSLDIRWMLLLNKLKFNDLSCLKILRLIKVRYDRVVFWQNLSYVCTKYPKSLTNLVELILIVEEARPLTENEAPLLKKNNINLNADATKNLDDTQDNYTIKNTKILKKCLENVGQQMVKLETCIVDVAFHSHNICNKLLVHVAQCQSLSSKRSSSKNGEGLKHLVLINLMRCIDVVLSPCVFQNLKCLIIESVWKAQFEVYSFFQMIDECRINVEASRGGNMKLFIKLRCYPGDSLNFHVNDVKPLCDIWKTWFYDGLIDFRVDCSWGTIPSLSGLGESEKEFRKIMFTADYFGDILNNKRDISNWADSLRTRVLKDCQINQTCVILPLLNDYESFGKRLFALNSTMAAFHTRSESLQPFILQNANLNPKLKPDIIHSMNMT